MLSLETNLPPIYHGGRIEDESNWPRKIPEDVFHEGQLSFKVKGSYKYQTKWGVLRFESAMGPKRLELFEADTKDKCYQINANIYPTTTIPFTQLLGFYPQHTFRRGLFPIQILLTYQKHQLATKTREEQQEWLTKLNTITYGSPRPHRTYEYMVMIFPTKLSNEVNLEGSYIFRVTEQSVHLISRDTSDHMTYTIPLWAIVKANHTVFSNSSIQFAPYSDRKSNIKVLALTIHAECDLKKGSYVFAATSAAEIVTVINDRRLKSCSCASCIPIKTHPTLDNGVDLSTTSPTQLQQPTTTNACQTLPSGDTPSPRSAVKTTLQTNSLEKRYDSSPTIEISHSLMQSIDQKTIHNTPPVSPTQTSPTLQESAHPKLKFKTNYKSLVEIRTASPISPPSTKTSVSTTPTTDPIHSTRKNHKVNQASVPNLSPDLTRLSTVSTLYLKSTPENASGANMDDNTSTTSSSPTHDYDYNNIINKTSPSGSPYNLSPPPLLPPTPPPSPSTAYATTEYVTSSKIHHEERNSTDCTPRNSKEDKLVVENPTLKRRSRSIGNSFNPILPPQLRKASLQSIHRVDDLQIPSSIQRDNHHFRSFSSDRSSTRNRASRHPSEHHQHTASTNLATHCLTKSCEALAHNDLSMSRTLFPYDLTAPSYESIVSNGPYEKIPQSKPQSIVVPKDSNRLRSIPNNCHNVLDKSNDSNDLQTTTHVGGMQKEYETIKNSGPYESIPQARDSTEDRPTLKVNFPKQKNLRPVPLPRKKKLINNTSLFVRNDSFDLAKCKSLTRTTTTPIGTMGKRSDSMGDLLDIRDNSEIYENQPTDAHILRGTLSSCTTPQTPSNEHSFPHPQDCKHHVMNLQSPEEQPHAFPQALPYAMVWLDRI